MPQRNRFEPNFPTSCNRLVDSLAGILNNIVHPPRTLSVIAKEYGDAEIRLRDATSDESISFWRSICSKLSAELTAMG